MVSRVVQAAVRFAAVTFLLALALGVALGGLILLDRLITWMAGI